MQNKNPGLLLLLGTLLALGGCYYDMDSVPFQGTKAGVSVKTLAGTGTQGAQNGAAKTSASFRKPTDVAVDQNTGAVYVADTNNHMIRMIKDGKVSTLAGTGKSGDSEGKAASAQFSFPMGVAVGGDGKVYVADTNNHRIKVISAGQVAFFAGSGKAGALDGGAGAAKFWAPRGLAVDSAGTVYVADSLNHRVRVIKGGQVVTATGIKSGLKGGYADGALADAKFKYPINVTLDEVTQKVYVADSGNHRIRLIAGATVSTVAGSGNPSYLDGPALVAQFNSPLDLAYAGQGKIHVVDEKNHRIRRVDLVKGNVTTTAGAGGLGYRDGDGDKALFNAPAGVAYDSASGILYVADSDNHRIRAITITP